MNHGLSSNTLGAVGPGGEASRLPVVGGFRGFGENPKQMVARRNADEFVTESIQIGVKAILEKDWMEFWKPSKYLKSPNNRVL